jgi:tyrosine-specific transport protein
VKSELLLRADAPAVLPAIPVLVLALVFHNVVPTISYQLGCDMRRVRTAILLGSALPAAMFCAWDAVILGSLPADSAATAAAAAAAGQTFDPLTALRDLGGGFGDTVRAFSLLAIVTSFIGFCYGGLLPPCLYAHWGSATHGRFWKPCAALCLSPPARHHPAFIT